MIRAMAAGTISLGARPVIAATLVALCCIGLPATAAGAPAAVDDAVTHELARTGHATVWVLLRGHADLSSAPSIRDWNERGRYVVDRLRATAANRVATAGLHVLPLPVAGGVRGGRLPAMPV